MKYGFCRYTIHENDLNVVKTVASELGLKITTLEGPRPLYERLFSFNADKEYYYEVEFEDIEVESFTEGMNFEDEIFWKVLLDRSTDARCLELLNS